MRRIAGVMTLVIGCVEPPVDEPTCGPLVSVDELHAEDWIELDMSADGTSICARFDTTEVAQPHLEVSAPTGFYLELRDLTNSTIATGEDVRLGSSSYSAVQWDPAGGRAYDVLVHVRPTEPVISAWTTLVVQLGARP